MPSRGVGREACIGGRVDYRSIIQRLNVWDRGGGGSGHRVLGRDVGPRWYRVED